MSRWRRPYSGGPFAVLVWALMLLGGLFLLSVVSDAVSGFGKTAGSATIELVVAVLLGGIWLGLLWRVSRLGVYVGNGGLRYIGPFCTVIVPWSEVRGVRSGGPVAS